MAGVLPTLSLEGPGFALAGSARQQLDVHERSFGLFVPATPGASGSVRAAVGTRTYSAAGSTYSVGVPLAAALEAKTRTSVLYADRSALRVAYQLRDAVGESRVSQSQLSVSLLLRFADGASDYVSSCSLPAQASGVGECASTVPSSSYGAVSRSATVEVSAQYGSGTAIIASGSTVTLQAAVSPSSLSAAGMLATLPQSPRFVGDEFDVAIYAHSGPANFALVAWSLNVQYDAGVLGLVQQQFSSVFQSPTYASDTAAGTFDVVTTGISDSLTNADVQGQTALYLMTLRFSVVGGASVGSPQSVINGTVGAMVNQGTQRYLSNAVMSVTDGRGGLQSEGRLTVESVQGVGVLAYSETGSFVNTAALDGQAITSSVTVVQL